MKKIMFTLAVGLIAIGTQANVVSWSFTSTAGGTYYADSADLGGYTAYLIQTADWTGKVADLDKATASATWATATDNGKGRQYKTATPVNSETTLTTGDYNFNVVLSDGTHYWASDSRVGTVYEAGSTDPNNKSVTLQFTGATAPTATSIQSFSGGGSDVPEPTSGLLLLVGGAMLALRRKQK